MVEYLLSVSEALGSSPSTENQIKMLLAGRGGARL